MNNTAARDILVAARRVMALQLGATTLIAAGFLMGRGKWEALSAVYGGLISILIALLLGRGVLRATDVVRQNHRQSMLILYVGAVQRFMLVLILFGLGLALGKLAPIATVAGFVGAQLAYAASMRRHDGEKDLGLRGPEP